MRIVRDRTTQLKYELIISKVDIRGLNVEIDGVILLDFQTGQMVVFDLCFYKKHFEKISNKGNQLNIF